MSDQDIRDRLSREADNWIERQQAEQAMRNEADAHYRRKVDLAAFFIAGLLYLLFVAAVFWLVTGAM